MRVRVFGLVFLPILAVPVVATGATYPLNFADVVRGDSYLEVAESPGHFRAIDADCDDLDLLANPKRPGATKTPRLPGQLSNATDLAPNLCLSM